MIVFIIAIRLDGCRLTAARHATSPDMPALQRFVAACIIRILNNIRVVRW